MDRKSNDWAEMPNAGKRANSEKSMGISDIPALNVDVCQERFQWASAGGGLAACRNESSGNSNGVAAGGDWMRVSALHCTNGMSLRYYPVYILYRRPHARNCLLHDIVGGSGGRVVAGLRSMFVDVALDEHPFAAVPIAG